MPTQKSFTGAAASTTLSAGISSSDTSFSVAAGSSYPAANFNIVIDKGLAGEEKLFIASRSGNTFTVSARGADSTTAAAHSSGATVQHCGFGSDFQENNDHINATTNVHGLTGGAAVVGTTSTQTLTNKTLTTPTIGDLTNANHTHANAAQGGTLPYTISTFTPTIGGTGWAVGSGLLAGRTLQLGKLVWFGVELNGVDGNVTVGSGSLTFALPQPVRFATSNANDRALIARGMAERLALGYPLGIGAWVLQASPSTMTIFWENNIPTQAFGVDPVASQFRYGVNSTDRGNGCVFNANSNLKIEGWYETP